MTIVLLERTFAQVVTNDMEKTTSCLKKDLQQENGKETIDLAKKISFRMKSQTFLEYKHLFPKELLKVLETP